MSSQVNLTTVGITDGISLANKIIVQGGVDGQFFPANQIGWGKSTFADKEFGGTTHGLLNAIETAINSVAVGGSDALNEAIETVKTTVLEAVEEKGYITLEEANTAIATALSNYFTKAEVVQMISDANATLETNLKKWVNEQGFAAAADVTAHTGNADVHVTAQQKADWQAAADAINAFLDDNATSDEVVNTLKELQEYISKDESGASGMLDAIAANKTATETNAAAIAANTKAIENEASRADAAEKQVLADAKAYADGLAVNYDENGAAASAEQNAKDYADGLAVNYDAAGAATTALTDAKAYVDGKVDGKFDAAGAAATALNDAKAYADGLAVNYDAAGAAADALADAKDYADGLAANYDVAGAANTALADAKKYADEKEAAAKAYADGLAGNYEVAGAAADALKTAKEYADGLAVNYDAAGAAATAEQNAKDYADGLAVNYDAVGAAATALNDAKAYADGLAGNYDAAGAAATAEQNAKAYADGKFQVAGNYEAAGAAAKALTDAKDYADEKIAESTNAITNSINDVSAKADANEAAIAVLNGDANTDGSVANKVATEIAAVVNNAPDSFDTLKEIADWIANDVTGAAALANKVSAIESDYVGKETFNAHKDDADVHVTADDKAKWNAAAAQSDLEALGTAFNTKVAELVAADAVIVTEYTAADEAIVSDYKAADEAIVSGYEAADEAIVSGYEAADADIIASYVAADNAIKDWVAETYTTTVNPNANSITVNGTKFTFSFTNNQMSVSEYIVTSLGTLSLSTISSTKTNTGGGNYYLGTTYSLVCGIDVTSTQQTLTIPVSNSTSNKYKLSVHDGTSYILEDADFRTTNGNVTQTIT